MRIIYYTQAFFSDCDFPLIRELQSRGLDFRVYIPMQGYRKRSGIIDIKQLKRKIGIYKASTYEDMAIYKDFVDLDRIFFINLPDNRGGKRDRLIWLMVFLHMFLFRPNIFHFTWPLSGRERWLYRLPVRKFMTVHDPISHSNVRDNQWEEEGRITAFNHSSRFVLLSNVLKDAFCQKYQISKDKIDIARLGEYSILRFIKPSKLELRKPYILFFGQIASHKGIEYLCEAMTMVHDICPELNLVIAGNGKMYFDFSKYKELDYIYLKNEFISVPDLVGLLQNALFSVCPYKDATQSGVVQTSFTCNTPMVVTNVGALPDAVRHGVTGLVVPSCDVESLRDAILELALHPEKLLEMKKNIEKLWHPSMEWGPIADLYMQSYRKIIC